MFQLLLYHLHFKVLLITFFLLCYLTVITGKNLERTFSILINELIFLENYEVDIITKNEIKKCYLVLGLVLSDNLGLHIILGFVESFVANLSCKFCKMNKTSSRTNYISSETNLRTIKNYKHEVKLNDVSLTGIKANCIFNSIKSFHVTNNLSVDIMHDLLEGVYH